MRLTQPHCRLQTLQKCHYKNGICARPVTRENSVENQYRNKWISYLCVGLPKKKHVPKSGQPELIYKFVQPTVMYCLPLIWVITKTFSIDYRFVCSHVCLGCLWVLLAVSEKFNKFMWMVSYAALLYIRQGSWKLYTHWWIYHHVQPITWPLRKKG